MAGHPAIRGLLLDLEGVLYQDGAAVAGAGEAIAAIRAGGLAPRFLTNTTTKPLRAVADGLAGMGFEIDPAHLFTPARAARQVLMGKGAKRVHLAAPDALVEDFAGFELVHEAPDAIVMGDLHEGFTWRRLDRLFRMILDGALLVALHKNRYCRRDGALALDAGPFTAALEYAADVEATVVGKPAPQFFAAALADLGCAAPEAVMVGDDIRADIGGALDAGLRAVQVRTGKYSRRDEDPALPVPAARLDSIADLPEWLMSGA